MVCKLDSVAISQSNIIKDLGIKLIDTDLKFHAHTSIVVARANRLLGIIKKPFEHLHRPCHVSEVVQVLNSSYICWNMVISFRVLILHLTKELLNVCRGLRGEQQNLCILDLKDYEYTEWMQALNLPSLSYRRIRGDLIFLYHLVHDDFNIDSSKFISYSTTPSSEVMTTNFIKLMLDANQELISLLTDQ